MVSLVVGRGRGSSLHVVRVVWMVRRQVGPSGRVVQMLVVRTRVCYRFTTATRVLHNSGASTCLGPTRRGDLVLEVVLADDSNPLVGGDLGKHKQTKRLGMQLQRANISSVAFILVKRDF